MIITAKDLHKSYGDVRVLKGVDIEIERGSIVTIVGASGAGKSTLLHILSSLDKADKGYVKINDIDITSLNDKKLSAFRNKHIGFIFQFHHLLPEFTAIENVAIPAFIAKQDKRVALKRAEEILDRLGLSNRIEHKPSQLSGGEQQRVAVARALINNPDVIFADEPSGNLDSKQALELHELFFRLRNEFGQTFVIVTHNQELSQMSDVIFKMKDGIIENYSEK